jgi:hypothetical protein
LPEVLADGVLYISDEFQLAAHKCCCGCGEDVITPLNEAQWSVMKRGSMVSLWPSVGNWKYACCSHYWITANQVIDAPPMTAPEIKLATRRDRIDKEIYMQGLNDEREHGLSIRWWSKAISHSLERLRALWPW